MADPLTAALLAVFMVSAIAGVLQRSPRLVRQQLPAALPSPMTFGPWRAPTAVMTVVAVVLSFIGVNTANATVRADSFAYDETHVAPIEVDAATIGDGELPDVSDLSSALAGLVENSSPSLSASTTAPRSFVAPTSALDDLVEVVPGGPKSSPNFKPPTNSPSLPPTEIPPGWRVREMPPSVDYPDGYWKLEKPMANGGWQPIDPSTMNPGSRPETHVPFPAGD